MRPMSTTTTDARPRRRVTLYVTGALIVVLVLVVAARFALTLGPMGTAQRFCTAAMQADYADIYQHMLTTTVRAQADQATFVAAEQLADQQAGKIGGCDISPLHVDLGWGTAAVHLTEHRGDGGDVAVTLNLNGTQITSMPDPAVLPLRTARAFCDDITRQDYPAAYHLLAPTITTALTQDNFTTAQQIFDQNGGTVTACTIMNLTLNAENTAATASAVARRQGGDTNGSAIQLKINRQLDGSWRLTNLPSA